jgi:hypothetical protein
MAFPETVRVKISSEAADTISFSQVVARDMPSGELVELILCATGKNPVLIHEVLLRGTAVSGASRFRWQGWDAPAEDIAQVLTAFPDSQPERRLDPARCILAVLLAQPVRIELPREACEKRRLLHRRNFWQEFLTVADECPFKYVEYSYLLRADRYRTALTAGQCARLRAAAGLLSFSSLAAKITRAPIEAVEVFTSR